MAHTQPSHVFSPLAIAGLILLAALSDFFDGYVARLTQPSKHGHVIDPICDFFFIIALMHFAYHYHALPMWFIIFMIIRYIIIAVMGAYYAHHHRMFPSSTMWGKITITLNLFTITYFIIIPYTLQHLILIVLATSVGSYSLIDYVQQFRSTTA